MLLFLIPQSVKCFIISFMTFHFNVDNNMVKTLSKKRYKHNLPERKHIMVYFELNIWNNLFWPQSWVSRKAIEKSWFMFNCSSLKVSFYRQLANLKVSFPACFLLNFQSKVSYSMINSFRYSDDKQLVFFWIYYRWLKSLRWVKR